MLSWRKVKREAFQPEIHELRSIERGRDNGSAPVLAVAQSTGDGEWFWYSMMPELSANTCRTPTTLERCKAEAREAAERVLHGRAELVTRIIIESISNHRAEGGE